MRDSNKAMLIIDNTVLNSQKITEKEFPIVLRKY